MPTIDLKLDGDDAWPDAAGRPIIHIADSFGMAILDGGMTSGKPSVALRFDLPDGQILIAETSLAVLSATMRAIWARYPAYS